MVRNRYRKGYPGTAGPTPVTRPAGKVTARGNSGNSMAAEFGNPDQGMRSLLVGWNELQPTAAATATGTEWTTLNNSIADAHTDGYQILLRVLSGTEHAPQWVYTHASPVPWVDSKSNVGPWPVQVGVAPSFNPTAANGVVQGDYPVPLPWSANPPASPTDTQVRTSVDSAPLRTHYRSFLTLLAGWLNGTCPGGGHTRAEHVVCVPCTMPTGHGSEMTTSDNNKVNGVTTYFKTSVQGNSSSIVGNNTAGTGKLQVAYAHAWRRCLEDHRELLPSTVAASVAGGHLFGDGSKNAMTLLETYGPTYGVDCLWIRTDFRQTYFSTFGGGLGSTYSPINFLRKAHELGVGYGIQTAQDSLLFDGGGPDTTDTFAGMVEELLSHLPNLRFFETAVSLCKAPSSAQASGGFFGGQAYTTTAKTGTGPYAGTGWPGGTANAARYLTTATGNVQSRLV